MFTTRKLSRLAIAALTAGLLALGGGAAVVPAAASSSGAAVATRHVAGPKPTIVLVHGAFADSSGWSLVGAALQAEGYPVLAFANPLRGVQYDSEYLRSFLDTITGPIVLVGHSYGGAVITNAATGDPDVKALVYVAAYALDAGETVQDANALGGGESQLGANLIIRPFPGAAQGDADAYINPTAFRDLFARDVPKPSPLLWPPRSDRLRSQHSGLRPASPHGKRSPLGTSSPSRTRPFRRRLSDSWRPGLARRPSRSTARTSR